MSKIEGFAAHFGNHRVAHAWSSLPYSLTATLLVVALIYRMEELDPYRGMPVPPPCEDSAPPSPYSDGHDQISSLMDGVRRAQCALPSMHADSRRGQLGQAMAGRRDGALSAQVWCLALDFRITWSIVGTPWCPFK